MTEPLPPSSLPPPEPGETRTQVILTYLADNPRRAFRPTEVGEAVGCTTHQAATSLWALWRRDLVARKRPPGNSRASLYQMKEWPE